MSCVAAIVPSGLRGAEACLNSDSHSLEPGIGDVQAGSLLQRGNLGPREQVRQVAFADRKRCTLLLPLPTRTSQWVKAPPLRLQSISRQGVHMLHPGLAGPYVCRARTGGSQWRVSG